ncbi:MAG TPA: phosphotransferase [Ktedonobacteraceae bacterium]|nr:phosphotransferase [Ktedonobacteraceae bacterium]
MDIREFTMTDFVLLQNTWTCANCLALLEHLQPAYAIIFSAKRPEQYYLLKASDLSTLLVDAPHTASLADILGRTASRPVPAIESDTMAEDAPGRCIILEDGYPVGFFDASVPSNTSRGYNPEANTDTLPVLSVDAPETVALNDVFSVLVMISVESLATSSDEPLLNLPTGAAVDIVLWPRKGLVIEGKKEGQLVIPGAGETLPLQFRLRGVEAGLRKLRICVFHKQEARGILSLSIQVLGESQAAKVSHHSEVYPLQELSASYPDYSSLISERYLAGKAAHTPQGDGQMDSATPLEETVATTPPQVYFECDLELLARGLWSIPVDSQTNTPSKEVLESELRDLLQRLFSHTNSLIVEALTPGFSGAKVLKVLPFLAEASGGRWFIVKFGAIRELEQEYLNYKKYIYSSIKDGYSTAADKYEHTLHLGGILYSFIGTDIRYIESFGHAYQTKPLAQIRAILDILFRSICRNWYASTSELQPRNLTEVYQREGHDKLVKQESSIAARLPAVQFRQTLFFQSFKKTPSRSFPNPFRVLAHTRAFIRPTYVCTTHGDLNHNNILVDQANYSWLIDFQHAGQSHILRDITTLDAVIRFQLLLADQVTLDEFLEMEEVLCSVQQFSQLNTLQESFLTNNPALLKVYQTVLHLRMLAYWMVERNPADDMSEYYIALLYRALDTLHYDDLKEEQHERALLSASLLIDRLGLDKISP